MSLSPCVTGQASLSWNGRTFATWCCSAVLICVALAHGPLFGDDTATAARPAAAAGHADPPALAPVIPAISRQSEEEIAATFATLRQIDDLPFFVMTFVGDYDAGAPLTTTSLLHQQRNNAWGCSLFAALGDSDNRIMGRNFDWLDHPALLLFTNPSDGYASVAMVDINYLGFDRRALDEVTSEPHMRSLLAAPLIPFDGMNEHGLAIGMAAVEATRIPFDWRKPTVHGVQIIRLMLDRARTVDEALALLEQFNISFIGGPHIHYLITDAEGAAAVVELKDGKLHILRHDRPWHLATNFYLTGTEENAEQLCRRYAEINRELVGSEGVSDTERAMDLLRRVKQPHTRWSAVYDLSRGEVHIAWGKDFDRIYRFELQSKAAELP